MFDGSFDLVILSGLLALPGLTWPYIGKTLGKAVLVVWLCDCHQRQSGGALSCQSSAQSLKRLFGVQPAPGVFPGHTRVGTVRRYPV
ncbi:MAG: hypothetical protein GDA36_09570 [Rhodobacteraceae bacterium]|nr:hypothetical protein [Paracoccaceae bacterium]